MVPIADALDVPAPAFTVAILTYNALADTQRCLQSLALHTPQAHRVCIFDNASTDGTREWLVPRAGGHLSVTLGERNFGVPGGRNRLLELILPTLADDDFVVFLDNDIEVHAGWAEPFLELLAADPRIGIAGRVGHAILVGEAERTLLPPPDDAAPVDVASGGFACWVRARTARAVGAFDEALGLFWHEDDDYCVRALSLGHEVFAVPHAAMTHHAHGSGVALPELATAGSPRNQAYLAKKWRAAGHVDEDGWVVRRDSPYYLPPATRRALLGERTGPAARTMLGNVLHDVERLARNPAAALRRVLRLHLAVVDELQRGDERVRARLRQHPSSTIGARVTVPVGQAAGDSLSRLCRAEDFEQPQWRQWADALADDPERTPERYDRLLWETAHVLHCLQQTGHLHARACGFVLRPGVDALLWALAERTRLIVSADLHGDLASRVGAPGVPQYPSDRLRVLNLDPSGLPFSTGAFDFACAVGTPQLFLQRQDAARSLAELGRIVKPGGSIIVSADVVLDGAATDHALQPDELVDLLDAAGLQLAADLDLTLTPRTLEGWSDGGIAEPHLILERNGRPVTSAVLVLRRAEVLIPAAPRREPSARAGIDLRCLYHDHSVTRGIGHYVCQQLETVLGSRPQWSFQLFGHRQPAPAMAPLLRAGNAEFVAEGDYRPGRLDLLHVPDPMNLSIGFDAGLRVFREARTTVTFYDLTPRRLYWDGYDAAMRAAYEDRLALVQDRADAVLAISEFTRRDLLACLPIDPARVHVVGAGLNRARTRGAMTDPRARLRITQPFFLHVGGLDPHKNFTSVLAAFLECRRAQACQLVVAGRRDGIVAAFERLCEERGFDGVVFTGFLEREELEVLYANATALLSLSLYEGFGFPVLEAMALGSPVIASDRTSIPEVAGDACWLVDPEDRTQAAQAMRALLEDPARGDELRRRGRERARAFSWERVGRATLAVWEQLLAPRSCGSELQAVGGGNAVRRS